MVNISIIMPLYNAEKYLAEALQSIQSQTYKDFELICINDASTDATMEILQQFQNSDSRIRIFENQERFGAAFSRNRGIRDAQGEYITFLDGDDIFEEEMLASANKTAKGYDADIVIYEYKHVPSKDIYEKKSIQRNDRFIEKYCRTVFSVRECEPIEFANWSASPCNKLFRKSLINDNQLEFQSLSSANDVYFVDMALLLARKIIMLDDGRVMVYARDHEMPTRISYDRDPMCVYLAMEKLGQELVVKGLFSEMFQYYYYLFFFNIRHAILKTKNEEKAKLFYNFIQKEGINNIANLHPEYYQKTDNYIYALLENYRRLDFSSGWYKSKNVFYFYLCKNAPKVISLLQSYEDCHTQTALWGAGENGKAFLSFLNEHNLRITEVIDRDVNKQGNVIDGYVIKKPEDVLDNIQAIIACTSILCTEIVLELQGKNIDVVDIENIIERV